MHSNPSDVPAAPDGGTPPPAFVARRDLLRLAGAAALAAVAVPLLPGSARAATGRTWPGSDRSIPKPMLKGGPSSPVGENYRTLARAHASTFTPVRPPATPLIVRSPYLSCWQGSDDLAGTWSTFWNGHITALCGIARIDGTAVPVRRLARAAQRPDAHRDEPGIAGGDRHPLDLRVQRRRHQSDDHVLLAGRPGQPAPPERPVRLRHDAGLEHGRQRPQRPGLLRHLRRVGARRHCAEPQLVADHDLVHRRAHQHPDLAERAGRVQRPGVLGHRRARQPEQREPQLADRPGRGGAGAGRERRRAARYTGFRSAAADLRRLAGVRVLLRPRHRHRLRRVGRVPGRHRARTHPVRQLPRHRPRALVDDVLGFVAAHGRLVRRRLPQCPAFGGRAGPEDPDRRRERGRRRHRPAPSTRRSARWRCGRPFGGTELVDRGGAPWAFLKEISSDGNVSTVDVVYPASPAYLHLSPSYLRLLLEPLLYYAENGWIEQFAEHDLGCALPERRRRRQQRAGHTGGHAGRGVRQYADHGRGSAPAPAGQGGEGLREAALCDPAPVGRVPAAQRARSRFPEPDRRLHREDRQQRQPGGEGHHRPRCDEPDRRDRRQQGGRGGVPQHRGAASSASG